MPMGRRSYCEQTIFSSMPRRHGFRANDSKFSSVAAWLLPGVVEAGS